MVVLGPIFPYDPSDLPSLVKLFGCESRIFDKLELAGFRHVVEIMLVPSPGLMMYGLNSAETSQVNRLLRERGLAHIGVSERRVDFVDQQFGGVENAPLYAANTVSLYNEARNCRMTEFRPLRLINSTILAQRWEAREQGVKRPLATLGWMARTPFDEVQIKLAEWNPHGPNIRTLHNETYELSARMNEWGLSLNQGPRLSVVPNHGMPGIN